MDSTPHQEQGIQPGSDTDVAISIPSMEAYYAFCKEAEEDYEGFWERYARQLLHWTQPFTKVLNESDAPFYKWFEDGKLNASYNCLDRHLLNGNADKIAIRFESDRGEVTHCSYRELHAQVCRFANGLKSLGLKKGDRAVIYMPMSVEGVVAMQACARLGIMHSVVFAGFSAKSLHERLVDVEAKVVITADEQMRGGRILPVKAIVDEALGLADSQTVENVIVYRRTGGDIAWTPGRDRWMDEVSIGQPDSCPAEPVSAEHPLFVLYTSGSTGKPKGVQHSTAGYLLWALMTMRWTFDLKPDDVFWCTADIGWVTGHTYIAYGPLIAGATQVMYEGVPSYPNSGRFWDIIQSHKVSIFYTAPTAIRSLIKSSEADGQIHPRQYDLSSLRLLGSVGEPINPEAWRWYHKHVGKERCPIVDTFWQTETGGHMITPLPVTTPLVPGSCMLPLPGIMAAVVDEAGHEVPNGQAGLLVITRPWPSLARTIWRDPERFRTSYFPQALGGKLYLAGDGCVRDKETGYFTITGRVDDVLNVSGHRMGSTEIESALVANSLVAEAAVVGRPDAVTGEAICAFVVLKGPRPGAEDAARIAAELSSWVGREIGPIAKPKDIRFGDNLPKTRSGKIMRRLLRSLAEGKEITQDTSALENPAILEQLKSTK
ncbi:acetate--CoA ligase [Paenalcaligenes niemegkensis]|uniref:acetate--CoA ligase n=1 Tax=Paenalcaligenes niemegkensis TaxID=2895469 RepID=UPI001EE8336C|nr:acetate--CoA ligase [Paenalcaligenes niemegkensis]MCQ9617915.1 acetate--CoA ligase [Paenalcaligenes niemegkensis]